MTDPDLTALAVDAARLVGWEWRQDYPFHGDHLQWAWWRGGCWTADKDADLLDDTDNPALLLAALLDWCAERGLEPSIYRRGKLWRAHADRCGNHWEDHPTKLGALLLAMHRAGVVG